MPQLDPTIIGDFLVWIIPSIFLTLFFFVHIELSKQYRTLKCRYLLLSNLKEKKLHNKFINNESYLLLKLQTISQTSLFFIKLEKTTNWFLNTQKQKINQI